VPGPPERVSVPAQPRDLTPPGAPTIPVSKARTRGDDEAAIRAGTHPLYPYRVRLDLPDTMLSELKYETYNEGARSGSGQAAAS